MAISSITVLFIYAIVFETTPISVTRDATYKQIDELETAYPDSTLIALGDLNHVDIKLTTHSKSTVQHAAVTLWISAI